jgi:hypothetical protein
MIAGRLGVRMQGRELFWALALVGALVAGMSVTSAAMLAVVGSSGCDADFRDAGCSGLISSFAPWEQAASTLIGLLWIIPTGLGALLGVGITAGEVEGGSAQLSWSLSPARIRWLLLRTLPVGLVLVLVLTVGSGFAEVASRARLLTDDPGFHDYHLRTALVPARGLLAFSVGLVAGAAIGRRLPALLVAIAFSTAITIGVILAFDVWHIRAATFVTNADLALDPGSYPMIPGTRSSFAGPGGDGVFAIPPADFWTWIPLEAAALVVVALVGWALAAGVVDRRRP